MLFRSTSDSRYKENVASSTLGLSFLNTLRPVQYTRIGNQDIDTEFGFIAQELESSLASTTVGATGLVSTDSRGYKSVRYNDLFSPMVKAIQELDAKIASSSSLVLASTTNLISGNIVYNMDVDMNNYSIRNVKSISSANGKWSISESGRIIAKTVVTNRIEMLDTNGSTYCYASTNGNMTQLGQGGCDNYPETNIVNSGNASSTNNTGTSTATTTTTTTTATTTNVFNSASTTGIVITLIGQEEQLISGTSTVSYSDPGATAIAENVLGETVTVPVSSITSTNNVDMTNVGAYTVTYTAIYGDIIKVKTRTVIIQ